MKQLIDNIQKSIYGPEYYVKLLNQPLRASFKYFFALTMLVAVFFTIVTSIPLVANANRVVHELPPKFFAYFPDELELTIKNGTASTNVTEPYFLPVPDEFNENTEKEGIVNVVVIDTINPFSVEQFNTYQSVVWVGANQIAYHDKQGSVRIETFSKDINYILNEQKLRDLEARVSPYYGFISPLMVILIFITLLIALSVNLVYLLFGAVLILLLGRFMKIRLSYWKSYQIGLHAITLALLIDTLLSMSGLTALRVPFAPTLTMLLVMYVNFKSYHSVNSSVAPIKG